MDLNDPYDVPEFSVAVARVGDERLVVIRGELDLAVVDRLWGCLGPLLADGTGPLVLDFSGVSFVDSSGINVLTRAHYALGGEPGSVVVRDPSPQVRRVLELSGVDSYITVVPAGGVAGS